jgi:Arc/MetJ-type ribon-helix-helix transcriptional regulator
MIICHTEQRKKQTMATEKIAITLDEELVTRLDRLVSARKFPSRSRAVQEAVREKLDRIDRRRLANECNKLDPTFEQELAEQGMNADAKTWPEY